MNLALTTYDKALIGLGALAVSIGLAANVDVSGPVQALIGLGLVLLPVAVYYKANRGISYEVATKAIAALPAAIAGVVLLFGIDVSVQLERIGQDVLALVPLLIATSGNPAPVIEGSGRQIS